MHADSQTGSNSNTLLLLRETSSRHREWLKRSPKLSFKCRTKLEHDLKLVQSQYCYFVDHLIHLLLFAGSTVVRNCYCGLQCGAGFGERTTCNEDLSNEFSGLADPSEWASCDATAFPTVAFPWTAERCSRRRFAHCRLKLILYPLCSGAQPWLR